MLCPFIHGWSQNLGRHNHGESRAMAVAVGVGLSIASSSIGPPPCSHLCNRAFILIRTYRCVRRTACCWTGPAYFNDPWSGFYQLGAPFYTQAQMTQFTEIGWRFLQVNSAFALPS